MNCKYPLLIPTIGHGSTDLITNPSFTLSTHFFSFLLIKFIPPFSKKIILISSSIKHISNDINIYNSLLLHGIWLKYPITSKLYLSCIHTPLHYIRFYKNNNNNNKFYKQCLLAIFTTGILYYGLINNYDIKVENIFGELWWVAPVFSHIYINENINY